jgi:hypothetical protein
MILLEALRDPHDRRFFFLTGDVSDELAKMTMVSAAKLVLD